MAAIPRQLRAQAAREGHTIAEELANLLVLVVGAALAGVGLFFLVGRASASGDAWAVAASAVYGASVFLTFLFSAVYQGVWMPSIKAAFRILDHCSIFTLIAGTYTPIAVLALPQPFGWKLLAGVWSLGLVGIALRLWLGRLHWGLIPIFVVMGWLGMLWGDLFFTHLGRRGAWLLLVGGAVYTCGIALYVFRNIPFNRALWHLCVLTGAACHFAVIYVYVLPAVAPESRSSAAATTSDRAERLPRTPPTQRLQAHTAHANAPSLRS